jgi:hypothetical protein
MVGPFFKVPLNRVYKVSFSLRLFSCEKRGAFCGPVGGGVE